MLNRKSFKLDASKIHSEKMVLLHQGKSIRMMGVPENEVDEVLQSAKKDLRIAGFDEEEKRMRHRAFYDRNSFVQLPQGTYVFAEFRTLSIPGMEVLRAMLYFFFFSILFLCILLTQIMPIVTVKMNL